MEGQERASIRASINNAWIKLNEYYTLLGRSPLFAASVVLNPDLGLRWLETNWTSPEQLQWLRDAKEGIKVYFERWYSKNDDDASESAFITPSLTPRPEQSRFEQWIKSRQPKLSATGSELQRYYRLEPEQVDDPIRWWIDHSNAFPRLSRFALDILAIPAMSTDCERAFSLAKLTIRSDSNGELSVQIRFGSQSDLIDLTAALIEHAMPEFHKDGQGLINSTESLWKVLRNSMKDPQVGPAIMVLDALDESEAQYGIIWQVAVAYEFLLSTLEKAKTEATQRVEPSYYSSCVNSAWAKLNKYYTKLDETPIYYAATVLHPGIQWSFLTKAYGEEEEWLFAARQLIQKLWEEEYRDLPAQWEISSSNLPAAVRAREYNPFDSFQDELISSTRHGHDEATDELERWLSTKQDIYTTYDNPLEYWSAKRFEYPRVAKMAIDILSVPAMASECERTFSSAGSMVSPKRSRLDASTIAVTQTVRSWLRAGLLEGYEGLLKEVGDDKAED
ncbi:hypothetical protein BFJ63_vAg17098 [Fusarium oxysporum f. sp. narcissi]|uniref:HAT C-terminal dimerisation domain-containing protein n=1 Tax=Fusarium oxysporum f. sp. narcissi TaxID=451672 RepID=A0A4Q2V7U5_FUSOX|nr:hypothetical protein BFJ63_vAg17098 [Fusarium oxysporum f. sp. narcissi]